MTSNDETATAPSAPFDVRDFARTARGSHREQLDLSALAERPLDADAVRLVRALRDLERATMQRMRNLLVTATHKDARVTAFLTTWAYEKFWLADALDAVLEVSPAADDLPAPEGARRRTRQERRERRGPVRRAIVANFVGPKIVAEHVTLGLVDEWITQAAYRRLADIAGALDAVAELAIGIKERHIDFLAQEAHRRLAESEPARRLTRRAIGRTAWPVGWVDRSAEERSFFERIVFGGERGRDEAKTIRARIAALPGVGDRVGATIEARLASP
jgi:hypothetical protein